MEDSRKRTNSAAMTLFSLIIFLLTTGVCFAQINTKQLEKRVEESIGNYYMGIFKINSDPEGIITVRGTVNTLYDKLKIQELISEVTGVTGIKNEIDLNLTATPDNEIKSNIEHEFQLNNVILEPEKIIVNVKNGFVSLSGTVSYFREKLMAQSIASWQDGVADLTSNIRVLSPSAARSDSNLKQIIDDIINKHFPLEKSVTINVTAGNVTLSGRVNSLYAKAKIQEDVYQVLGVKDVVNDLVTEKYLE
jgi:osmotically-inducible protein OsmY